MKKQRKCLICDEIRLSVGAAFNIFEKTVVREQGISFSLTTEVPNSEIRATMNEYNEIKSNPEKYKLFSSLKEALDEMLNDA